MKLVGARDVWDVFDTVNLIDEWLGKQGKGDAFDVLVGSKKAVEVVEQSRGKVVVMAGRNVAAAFGFKRVRYFEEIVRDGVVFVMVPHPSGVNMWWNDRGNERQAEIFLRSLVGAS